MKKRQFLTAAALAGAALPARAQGAPAHVRGPALLTLTGAVGKVNRPRFDPLRDQMMHKQKISFERAYAFDFDALAALPAHTIKPTLEYDGKTHVLRGPLLVEVLAAAGAGAAATLVLRAVDGYAVSLPLAQARAQGFIVATHLDGEAMALGGLGPLWAVYDADRVPAMAARPLAERFALCPWALYHIDIQI
ncbi:molybdopterin-dependent oxidoreductase [Janthinobacterium fluminis]|uniref:Molybdopterin-dependent oxidoreductase n=1 Tax=Janthinobacterium fluminis TaxID=2987524 RepID=A0ABT5JYS5_9BURK|nr:molybdopterin-dependent oxidoreductase [Janthinobacterium fluminis]MDC8757739.1 molybdopterin-dependent oxidoreductase [Janthinobacterium fluminis]